MEATLVRTTAEVTGDTAEEDTVSAAATEDIPMAVTAAGEDMAGTQEEVTAVEVTEATLLLVEDTVEATRVEDIAEDMEDTAAGVMEDIRVEVTEVLL